MPSGHIVRANFFARIYAMIIINNNILGSIYSILYG